MFVSEWGRPGGLLLCSILLSLGWLSWLSAAGGERPGAGEARGACGPPPARGRERQREGRRPRGGCLESPLSCRLPGLLEELHGLHARPCPALGGAVPPVPSLVPERPTQYQVPQRVGQERRPAGRAGVVGWGWSPAEPWLCLSRRGLAAYSTSVDLGADGQVLGKHGLAWSPRTLGLTSSPLPLHGALPAPWRSVTDPLVLRHHPCAPQTHRAAPGFSRSPFGSVQTLGPFP